MSHGYRRSWKEELEAKASRMVNEILLELPFLDDEYYVLYDLSLWCDTSVEDLKRRCMLIFKALHEIMNGEKELHYRVIFYFGYL